MAVRGLRLVIHHATTEKILTADKHTTHAAATRDWLPTKTSTWQADGNNRRSEPKTDRRNTARTIIYAGPEFQHEWAIRYETTIRWIKTRY